MGNVNNHRTNAVVIRKGQFLSRWLHKEFAFRLTLILIITLFFVTLPFFTDLAIQSLFIRILIFGLLAMSLDILVGYSGLWSFCHAALFGIGAYTTGILITRLDITSFWFSAPAGILMAGLAACLFGFLALRVSELYFLLITFALGQLVYAVAIKWRPMTGGFDGLAGIPYPDIGVSLSSMNFYYFVLVIFALSVFLLYMLTKSSFGLQLQGIREKEIRMICLGYNTWLHKYIVFIIGGLFAGMAGVLYVHYNGIITPNDVGMSTSGLIFLMVIFGGSGTLWGAFLGGSIVSLLNYFVSIFLPERWPLILGICFVAVVLIFRGGLWPYLVRLWMRITR